MQFLRKRLGKGVQQMVREAIKGNPQSWWVSRHSSWGMRIRNELRKNGFGEKELGVENLDNVYVGLIEEAVRDAR